MPSIDFHAQHSPLGAYATFTCGRFHRGGGFAIESGVPPQQNLVIGWIGADGLTRCLPFCTDISADLESFVEGASGQEVPRELLTDNLTRDYAAGTDSWSAGDFTFRIHTPVVPLPDPASEAQGLAAAAIPVVACSLELDNRSSKEDRTLIFHNEGAGAPRVMDGELVAGAVGVRFGRDIGIAASAGAVAYQHWSERDWHHEDRSHLLGAGGGLALRVPAGERGTLRLVVGFHRAGTVTTGVESRFYYTRRYASLAAVLDEGLARFDTLRDRALDLDARLRSSGLSPDRQWLVAHAQRSYWGNTQLVDVAGRARWIVLEGEYTMINTFDLAVDQCFYELRRNPWVVRDLLDHFVERYSYVDGLNRPPADASAEDRPTHCRDPHELWNLIPQPVDEHLPGGIAFCHDMGVNGHFSPPGHSSYECSRLAGCFSYMTCEQLLNWICVATSYYRATGDLGWLRHNEPILRACLQSLLNRDDPDPADRNGVNGLDSDRCDGGWEITTYDSLDPSLGQARNNLYMAVKGWAAYLGLASCFDDLQAASSSASARGGAERAAATVVAQWRDDLGHLPAVFDPANRSGIIPAIEGLVFPLVWGLDGALDTDGPWSRFLQTLRRHLEAVLQEGRCLFADGGWKLSSTADNSWMSKIFICQHVAERVFGIVAAPEADRSHVAWQAEGSADWAFSDQCVVGVAHGSKYYPRGVTNDLWLQE